MFEGFSGYGFSLKDEKGRFAIPVDFRADLKLSSEGKTICLDIHPEWECISAFGISRKRDFHALIEQARQDALATGKPFDRLTWQAQLNAFDKVAFDSAQFTPGDYTFASVGTAARAQLPLNATTSRLLAGPKPGG